MSQPHTPLIKLMGFHFPPHVEPMRQQSNLELEHELPPNSNVIALPLGAARELKPDGVYPAKRKQRGNIVRLDVVPRAEDENNPAA